MLALPWPLWARGLGQRGEAAQPAAGVLSQEMFGARALFSRRGEADVWPPPTCAGARNAASHIYLTAVLFVGEERPSPLAPCSVADPEQHRQAHDTVVPRSMPLATGRWCRELLLNSQRSCSCPGEGSKFGDRLNVLWKVAIAELRSLGLRPGHVRAPEGFTLRLCASLSSPAPELRRVCVEFVGPSGCLLDVDNGCARLSGMPKVRARLLRALGYIPLQLPYVVAEKAVKAYRGLEFLLGNCLHSKGGF